MGELVDVALAFIERCDRHTRLRLLIDDFSSTVSKFGFNHFMMTRLPALNEDAEPYVIAHTWPLEWLAQYREQAYFWHDPVSLQAFASARPYSWHEARKAHPRRRIASRLASEARSIGLFDGVGFPMGDPFSVQAVVSLATDRTVDLDRLSREMLHMVCLHAEMRAVEIHGNTPQIFATLTERERECLRWIANGKSAEDVGNILSLSERTVRKHLTDCRAKLQATTTTHAVARAIKSRQIIL